MSGDTLVADTAGLSPRAHVALLTLQLRAAIREAEDAELAEEQWDADAASAHLRDRLQPLVDERRAALEVELDQARTEALARIDAVRAVIAASPPIVAIDRLPDTPVYAVEECTVEVPEVEVPEVEVSEVEEFEVEVEEFEVEEFEVVPEPEVVLVAEPDVEVRPDPSVPTPWLPPDVAPTPADRPRVAAPTAGAPAFAPPMLGRAEHVGSGWARPGAPAAPLTADDVRTIVAELLAETTARQSAPLPVAMDPEAFSRAFAAAFGAALGAALDERLGGLPYGAAFGGARFVPPVPKRSFWTNMWHADVMMSLLAAVIVLVVLIAWST
jgi:hypothetical protein